MTLLYWEYTFDSKRTFEKHLRAVSRAASQRLGILRKSWQVFHDRLLLGRCFWGFVLPVLKYCFAVWCSAADTHLKLLDRVVSGTSFLTGGVCLNVTLHIVDLWQYYLCCLSKIRCNPMHPLYGTLPVPYVPVRVIRSAVIARRYTYASPRSRTSQYSRTFIPSSVSMWNDLTPCSMVWDWRVSRAGPMPFYWAKLLAHFFSPPDFPFSSFILWVGIVRLGSSELEGVNRSLPALHDQSFLKIIIPVTYCYQSGLDITLHVICIIMSGHHNTRHDAGIVGIMP